MKRQPFLRMTWPLVIVLSLALSIFLLLVSVNRTAAQGQQREQSRQLQQTEAVSTLPSKAKRYALVIGVDQYRDGNISPLRGAANDAGQLSRALTENAGFPADQVILLATDQPEERQPTRINILTYLSNLASAVPKDGLLLISFAGHGVERNGQAYLIPSDARLTDDVSLLEETAISVERMHRRIQAAGVAQVVVLLDACRNDPGGRGDAPNPLTQSYVRGFNFDVRNREVQAFATIYATAVGERAYEYQEKKQGYFTWAVVEGLKGGAANGRGEVTLASLVKYVQDVVPKRIAIDLGAGKKQYPFAVVEGYRAEELIVAVVPTATPSSTTTVAAQADPVAIELAYWDTIKNSNNPEDFKAYLEKYPNGQFAGLARLRVQPAAPQPAASTDRGKAMVKLNVRFIDRNNRPLNDVRQEEVTISEDGVPQAISYFSKDELPISYGLVVDNSGSMRTQLNNVIEAGKAIINGNKPGDETCLVRFISSDKIEVVKDFTADKNALANSLESMFTEGGYSAVVDAIYLSAQRVANRGEERKADARHALILITDGDDQNSFYTQEQLLMLLRQTDVQVFVIGFVNKLDKEGGMIRKSSREKAVNFLDMLARETGGRAFYPSSVSELPSIASEIIGDLRTQYIVGYSPINKSPDGSYHTVHVSVADSLGHDKRIAITRPGYATKSN